MKQFPAKLDFKRLPVLVVGGDDTVVEYIRRLYGSRAKIHVVSREPAAEIVDWAIGGALILDRREFRKTDLDDIRLVVASGDAGAEVSRIAREKDIPVHVVGDPQLSDFG